MYLIILLEILLVISVIMILVMKRMIANMAKENLKLRERIQQLSNQNNEACDQILQLIGPSMLADEINEEKD